MIHTRLSLAIMLMSVSAGCGALPEGQRDFYVATLVEGISIPTIGATMNGRNPARARAAWIATRTAIAEGFLPIVNKESPHISDLKLWWGGHWNPEMTDVELRLIQLVINTILQQIPAERLTGQLSESVRSTINAGFDALIRAIDLVLAENPPPAGVTADVYSSELPVQTIKVQFAIKVN